MTLSTEAALEVLCALMKGHAEFGRAPLLKAAKECVVRTFFEMLALFAEHERKSEPSEWRHSLAESIDRGAIQTKADADTLLRSTPLSALLNGGGNDFEGECGITSFPLALAADLLSRPHGPLDTREWTDFTGMAPRDLGRLYETFSCHDFDARPASGSADTAAVTWKVNDPGRKASGSYYTPEAITGLMTSSALRHAFNGTEKPFSPLDLEGLPKILDPAMGCGYFLLEAAQQLYETGLNTGKVREEDGRLALRQSIAKHALYGVDIDPVAVQVSRLALSSWVAGRVVSVPLPKVCDHLRCGNSLIGEIRPSSDKAVVECPPYAADFHWHHDFPALFHPSIEGGFDVVIGNPPYDNSRGGLEHHPELAEIARYARGSGRYQVKGAVDLYRLFLQRSLQLCRSGGIVSLIVPRTLLGDRDAGVERRILAQGTEILSVEDFPHDDASRRVFPSASLAVCIVTCRKGGPTPSFPLRRWSHASLKGTSRVQQVDVEALERYWPGYSPFAGLEAEEWEILHKIHASPHLCPLSEIADGGIGEANSGYHREFMVGEDTGTLLIRGSDVSPYHIQLNGGGPKRWIDREGFLNSLSEGARRNLKWDRVRVVKQAVRNLSLPKRLVAGLVEPGCFFADSTDFFVVCPPYDPRYLLALMNSRTVMEWLFRLVSTNNNVNLYQVRHLPVPKIDFEVNTAAHRVLVEEGWERVELLMRDSALGSGSDVVSRVRREWEGWLENWLPPEESRESGQPKAAHDLLVRISQTMIDLARQQREALPILYSASEMEAKRLLLAELIDGTIWSLYGLSEREAAVVSASISRASGR